MKIRIKHLCHPLRTLSAAKALAAVRLNMWRVANQAERRFGGDPRYDLRSVTDGFASRIVDRNDDIALLERVCTAYTKAVNQQQLEPPIYEATEWWEQVRQQSLNPVMHALLTHDIDGLRTMYRNFFRDPCSTGLIGVPNGMSKAYFGRTIKDVHRRFYLSDVLYRIDHWMERTDGRFALRDLAGPEIGNPFGALISGTLVQAGAEYQHYCAHKVSSLLDSEIVAAAEIGGGFGGMAYYLLRDRPGVTYLDFDVPESLALASYYLMKAFPQSTFLLYGEEETTMDAIARADVVLLPLFELSKMPARSVAVSFSSHAISDISPAPLVDYLDNIARMTQRFFLYVGIDRGEQSMSELISRRYASFKLVEARSSGWHSHKISRAGEVECLYRIGGV